MSSPLPLAELRPFLDDLRAQHMPPAVRRERLRDEQARNLAVMNELIADSGGELRASDRRKFESAKTAFDLIAADMAVPGDQERLETESAAFRQAHPGLFGSTMGTYEREDSEQALIRSFLDGSGPRQIRVPIRQAMRERELVRGGMDPHEARAMVWDTGSIGSGVPTLMASQLYEVLEESVAMLRMPTTKLPTATGANIDIPKLTTHAIATQVIAQGTAIGGSDPAFNKTTLGAYKYGVLIQVSDEAIVDTSFDVLGMVARDSGRAVGRLVDADLCVGTGTGEPLGVFPAITGAGTVATGGSLLGPSYEKLVDLKYSIANEYRARGNAAWLMRDSTAGTVLKLRDGAGGTIGAPLWQPSTTGGMAGLMQPDLLLGDPAFTSANVASMASSAKILAYGDWSAYYIRHVGELVFERDDSYAFDKDLVTFRAKWRVDGDLLDTSAINVMRQVVA